MRSQNRSCGSFYRSFQYCQIIFLGIENSFGSRDFGLRRAECEITYRLEGVVREECGRVGPWERRRAQRVRVVP
jgi:hypothetical protein